MNYSKLLFSIEHIKMPLRETDVRRQVEVGEVERDEDPEVSKDLTYITLQLVNFHRICPYSTSWLLNKPGRVQDICSQILACILR